VLLRFLSFVNVFTPQVECFAVMLRYVLRRTEWPRLKDATLHLNGIEQRYF